MVDSSFTPYAPDMIIGDKAYDSDKLDQSFAEKRGIELIAPHKRNRKKPPTQRRAQAQTLQTSLEGGALVCLVV